METCTFKLNIRENKILLSFSCGAICRQTRHFAYFIHKCLFGSGWIVWHSSHQMNDLSFQKVARPGWIVWHSSRQMNYLSFQESPDKSQISYFLLCNYIDLFIPVAILESDRLFNHA